MNCNSYDLVQVLDRARRWVAAATDAVHPSMRDFCLREAAWCERIVQESLHTPVLAEPFSMSLSAHTRRPLHQDEP
jgi:hypothetical protein